MRAYVKIFLAGLCIVSILSALYFLPIADWILALVSWAQSQGVRGMFVYGAFYAILTVFMIPGSLMTLGAGFIYGPLQGILLVSPASVLGASGAFIFGRYLFRSAIADRIQKNPKFAAVDRAIGKQGFKIVLLLRLSPLFPFTLLNYALGLTRISLWHYIASSFIGMLPGTFLYIYLGSIATTLGEAFSGGQKDDPFKSALYWGGLLATIVVTIFITRIAKKALKEALEREK